jgi:hypothetical protein
MLLLVFSYDRIYCALLVPLLLVVVDDGVGVADDDEADVGVVTDTVGRRSKFS